MVPDNPRYEFESSMLVDRWMPEGYSSQPLQAEDVGKASSMTCSRVRGQHYVTSFSGNKAGNKTHLDRSKLAIPISRKHEKNVIRSMQR